MIRRYIDQLCFYARENGENRVYMLMKDGEVISEELPVDIKLKFRYAGIEEPFFCSGFMRYKKEGK